MTLRAPGAYACIVKKGGTTMRRLVICIVIALLAIGLTACSDSGESRPSGDLPGATSPPTEVDGTRTATAGTVPYEVVENWTMPGGGPGESIVISNTYLNDDGAVLVGAQLQRDTAGTRNAVVFIFTDRHAAELRRFLLDASPDDQAFYEQHYAGQYTRNLDAGYHKLEMCYDGQRCTRGRTITY
jgi:hypothetical protein